MLLRSHPRLERLGKSEKAVTNFNCEYYPLPQFRNFTTLILDRVASSHLKVVCKLGFTVPIGIQHVGLA